jgi:predicted nucleic acid-binding Zn finger protein
MNGNGTKPTLPRPPRRARGTCRWVSRRHGVLRLNGALYTAVPAGATYRLLNWGNGNAYAVDAGGRWCTCPSFVWDHCPAQAGGDGRCKHIAALRALGLLPHPATV